MIRKVPIGPSKNLFRQELKKARQSNHLPDVISSQFRLNADDATIYYFFNVKSDNFDKVSLAVALKK